MNKQEFLRALRGQLSFLPKQEVEERVLFYSEMIDDRVEEGLCEEEAVRAVGPLAAIVAQSRAERPVSQDKEKRGKNARAILSLVLGAPIWLSLLVAAFAVVLSLYVSLWAVVVSLWTCFLSLAVCLPAGIVMSIWFGVRGSALVGVVLIGVSLVCGGLAIPAFYGCKALTRAAAWLTRAGSALAWHSIFEREGKR